VSGQSLESCTTAAVAEPATGLLALVGDGEWQAGADYDAELLERSGCDEVLILPTAAAYEHP
jgi:cyanophycinase